MQPLYYDVAVSADGYICGVNEDISRFPQSGPIVDAYLARLTSYAVAVMGAATYQFGLNVGLPAGANPYPMMRSVVCSKHMQFPQNAEISVIRDRSVEAVAKLRRDCDGPIYLCGGGQLAGSLLSAGLITALRLKRAPILLGAVSGCLKAPHQCQSYALSIRPPMRMGHFIRSS